MISEFLYFDSHDSTEATEAPNWWMNFIRAHPPSIPPGTFEQSYDHRNSQLLEYSAQIHKHKSVNRGTYKNTIDFYDEKAYAWFMLKYS